MGQAVARLYFRVAKVIVPFVDEGLRKRRWASVDHPWSLSDNRSEVDAQAGSRPAAEQADTTVCGCSITDLMGVAMATYSIRIAAIAVGVATLGACGTPTPAASDRGLTVVTVTSTQTVTATAEATSSSEATSASDGQVLVPDGVGKDYQTAQDLWRAAGLSVAPANDATGANRLPIVDSNWVVLSQEPAAGTSVPNGTSITATVKKYTDS